MGCSAVCPTMADARKSRGTRPRNLSSQNLPLRKCEHSISVSVCAVINCSEFTPFSGNFEYFLPQILRLEAGTCAPRICRHRQSGLPASPRLLKHRILHRNPVGLCIDSDETVRSGLYCSPEQRLSLHFSDVADFEIFAGRCLR